ncbi:MAG: hypothetical protein ABWZ85_06440 [Luteibacter sp.]
MSTPARNIVDDLSRSLDGGRHMDRQRDFPATPGWLAHLFDFDGWLSRHEFRPAPHGQTLRAGERVEFELNQGEDGPPFATEVRPLDDD